MTTTILTLILYLLLVKSKSEDIKPCRAQRFGYDSIACACDESYCDSFNPRLPSKGEILHIYSNKAGDRFSHKFRHYSNACTNKRNKCVKIVNDKLVILTLNRSKKYQKIEGFGSAFSDATGYNLNKMSQKLQDDILKACYGSEGLGFNFVRTTMAHSDYSLNVYYYNDSPYDVKQENWTLKEEDFKYRIPFIRKARDLSKDFRLISSIWTVPSWMRQYDIFGSKTVINKQYYHSYALYIIKYLLAFKKEGIDHFGVSYANEPIENLGVNIVQDADKMFTSWSINRLIDFGTDVFIPALKENGLGDLKVVFFDETRFILKRSFLSWMKKHSSLSQHIEYAGIHGYSDNEVSEIVLDNFHNEYPNVTILNTEFCSGQDSSVQLGTWAAAEYYAKQLFNQINHHVSGWIDWTLAVDTTGGPHILGVDVDSTIVVDAEKKTFYKQPSFYVMGHFSKFMPRGSVRVDLKSKYSTSIKYAAVKRPDNLTVVVLYNQHDEEISVTIKDDVQGNIDLTLTANSVNTVVF